VCWCENGRAQMYTTRARPISVWLHSENIHHPNSILDLTPTRMNFSDGRFFFTTAVRFMSRSWLGYSTVFTNAYAHRHSPNGSSTARQVNKDMPQELPRTAGGDLHRRDNHRHMRVPRTRCGVPDGSAERRQTLHWAWPPPFSGFTGTADKRCLCRPTEQAGWVWAWSVRCS
jgi:hypothetical protein